MKAPHVLLASTNSREMISNLSAILDGDNIFRLKQEIDKNVVGIIKLGLEHYEFARAVNRPKWRQIISRCYYAAYCIARAIRLYKNGLYIRDVSDHKKAVELPEDFPNKNTYANRLKTLREDRNLADYDHTSTEADLIFSIEEVFAFLSNLISDAKEYLSREGLNYD